MTSSMRRIVLARGTSSMLALALLLGGCGGGEDAAAGRAAPANAAPDTQVAAAERTAQGEAVELRSAPGPSQRRKARSRDWKGVTALVAARDGDVIGAADDKGRVRLGRRLGRRGATRRVVFAAAAAAHQHGQRQHRRSPPGNDDAPHRSDHGAPLMSFSAQASECTELQAFVAVAECQMQVSLCAAAFQSLVPDAGPRA